VRNHHRLSGPHLRRFSLTQQGIALGCSHACSSCTRVGGTAGRSYIPALNRALWLGCVLLVLGFQTSTNLAAAYGFAVSGVMLVTTAAMYVIARRSWDWSRLRAGALFGFFLVVEIGFFCAASLKLLHGAYVPLLLALLLFATMTTWRWVGARWPRATPDRESCPTIASWRR